MDNAFITGIAGQIGNHLGRYLRKAGYRVIGCDIADPQNDACDEFHRIDISAGRAELTQAVSRHSCGYLIHLAAIVAPTEESSRRIFSVNVQGTYNVVKAAEASSRPRLIFMSSESTLGFAFSHNGIAPLFAPITEEHPLRAIDPYGSSKCLAETLTSLYSERTGAVGFSLRPPWVWIPEKAERYVQLVNDPAEWAHGLWAYIAIEDLCTAVVRAMGCRTTGHHALFLAADTNGTRKPSAELLQTYYGFTGFFGSEFGTFGSVLSSEKARKLLAWKPQWRWEDWLNEHLSTAGMTSPAETDE